MRFFLTTSFIILLTFSTHSAQAEPNSCSTDLSDFILPCFVAYEDELRSFHHEEILNVADLIQEKFEGGFRVKMIAVYGYGVIFKPTDPAEENAKKRAQSVIETLRKELKKRGIKVKKKQFIAHGLIANHNPENGTIESTTKAERWIMRRAEIKVTFKQKKAKPKLATGANNNSSCQHENSTYVKRLERFNKNYTNKNREKAVRCMSDLLVNYYSCEDSSQGRYFLYPKGNVAYWARFADRFERGRVPYGEFPCKDKKGKELKACMGTIDKDIVRGLKNLNEEIFRFSLDVPYASLVRNLTECKIARDIISDAESDPQSPYRCYPEQLKALSGCL